jgi:Glycosyltransferase
MRIAIVAGYAPSLVNFRRPLLEALLARGHEVIALAPPQAADPTGGFERDARADLAALGVELVPFPMVRGGVNPKADAQTFLALRREFRRLKPELVIPYTIKPVIYGSLAARWTNRIFGRKSSIAVASLVTGLGYAFGDALAGGEVADMGTGRRVLMEVVVRLYRKALENNSVVFFQNPDDRDLFAKLAITGPATRSVVVNGSGVDLSHFAPALPVVADEQTGAPIFLCMARLLWSKGIGVYVEACRLLKRRYPQAVCRLLGPLDTGPDAVPEELVHRWREERVVEVLDPAADVRPHLAAASVFVLPTHYREGTPRSILEAMSMARPIITTDMPGCRQTVEEGVTGYLVPPFEPGALMRAMARFVEDPSLIGPMGQAARRLAEEKYGADDVALSMLRALGLAEGA